MPTTLFAHETANGPTADDTPFHRALRSRVYDVEEAMSLAASHRRQAAEARMSIPEAIDSLRDQSRALGLEQRAAKHEEIAVVCEQHAAELTHRPT